MAPERIVSQAGGLVGGGQVRLQHPETVVVKVTGGSVYVVVYVVVYSEELELDAHGRRFGQLVQDCPYGQIEGHNGQLVQDCPYGQTEVVVVVVVEVVSGHVVQVGQLVGVYGGGGFG